MLSCSNNALPPALHFPIDKGECPHHSTTCMSGILVVLKLRSAGDWMLMREVDLDLNDHAFNERHISQYDSLTH